MLTSMLGGVSIPPLTPPELKFYIAALNEDDRDKYNQAIREKDEDAKNRILAE